MSESLAWAAGLFDGEGCISWVVGGGTKGVRGKYRYPVIDITQHHNPEVLERFMGAVGLGKIYGPYKNGVCWYYRVIGKSKCTAVMNQIWPWLSTPKRKQAEGVLGCQ